jgi:hypothetical protein
MKKMPTSNNLIIDSEVFEVEKMEFYFKDYLSVPRAERVNIYYNLMDNEITVSDIELKYGNYLHGYNLKVKGGKQLQGTENIVIRYNTDVCVFYSEYRIVFLLDISPSMMIYDFSSQLLNIEKLELYLRSLLNGMINFEKNVKSSKGEDIVYNPKLILSFVLTGIDDECKVRLSIIFRFSVTRYT